MVVELRQRIEFIEEVECDEMWSFVGSKAQQRWLWYAIDHVTGKILAYVLGSRKDEAFIKSAYPPRSGWLAGYGRLKDGV